MHARQSSGSLLLPKGYILSSREVARSSREVARSEIVDFLNIKLRISRSSREVARSSREAIPVLETLGKSAPLPFSAQNTRKAGKFVRLRSCARVPSYWVRVDRVSFDYSYQTTTL